MTIAQMTVRVPAVKTDENKFVCPQPVGSSVELLGLKFTATAVHLVVNNDNPGTSHWDVILRAN